MRDTKAAFEWIVDILRKHNVPFQVTGGLAARIYGSPRELYDIDIDIPGERFDEIMLDIEPHIIFAPYQFKDENWDLRLMTLNYAGQHIDISAAETIKICDAKSGKWCCDFSDLKRSVEKEVFGMSVPVTCKDDLLAYKSKLSRECDIKDIKAIKGAGLDARPDSSLRL